jgi:GxxExxY protein
VEERDPLTSAVIGAAIEVHRVMGPGLLESVYQSCIEEELSLRGLSFQSQARLPLIYKGRKLGDDLVLDLWFPQQLVVELKSVEKILPVHEAQLMSYMKLSRTPIGLLINFNVEILKNGLKRMILSTLKQDKQPPPPPT